MVMDRFPDEVDPVVGNGRDLRVAPGKIPRGWGSDAERPIKDIRQVLRGAQVKPEDPPQKQREDIVRFYRKHLLTHGIAMRNSGETIPAFINGRTQPIGARWVALCTHCNSGIPVWPEWDQGCCADCGTVYTIAFPAKSQIAEAEAELAKRPRTENRNWYPFGRNGGPGETVNDLKAENERFGVGDIEVEGRD